MSITNGPLTINRARNSPIGRPPGTMQWLAPVGLSWISGGQAPTGTDLEVRGRRRVRGHALRHPCEDGEQAIMRAHELTPTVPEMAAPPIEPPEIQPPTPGNPTEPPAEEPPGNPRPEVPPPVREPGEPAPPDNLPGRTPDEFPVRGPNNPTTPNPAVSSIKARNTTRLRVAITCSTRYLQEIKLAQRVSHAR